MPRSKEGATHAGTAERAKAALRHGLLGLLPAESGAGPLLQRDYWAVIARCRMRPTALVDDVAARFRAFAPSDVVIFRRRDETDAPLEAGDEMEVTIRGAGRFRVRVIDRSPQTISLATLSGHPEAGRITFGAYRNDRGDVIFHIRSRARSSSRSRYAGFLMVGEAMQTTTWTDFVASVAHTFGEGVIGYIHTETTRLDKRAEAGAPTSPTFLAEGD